MLTLKIAFLIHHPFVTSTHPDLPIPYINLCHSFCLLLVVPISDNGWLTPHIDNHTGMIRWAVVPFLYQVALDQDLARGSSWHNIPIFVDDLGGSVGKDLPYSFNPFDNWIRRRRLE